MMQTKRYPVGIQTFSNIREGKYIYVDKTELTWKLANSYKYVFLSRPRRFGKSLLTSTLKSYFEGRRELFEGLAIEQMEREWTEYPVLHFSMADGKHRDAEGLELYPDFVLREWEKVYGRNPEDVTPNSRMKNLIKSAYEQTGKPVVVLIDEYDAPLLDTVAGNEEFDKLRYIMRNFYSPLKGADPYLRFVFLTGIIKFSQLSISSELNNIRNISMEDEFAAICGFTKDELLTQLNEDIDALAEKQEMSREEAIAELTRNYDSYHFTKRCPDIFNPYSLLNCFCDGEFNSYWFGSGTPTVLVEQMQRFGMIPTELGGEIKASESMFDTPTEQMDSILALLYQSGYLTIKSYDRYSRNYRLGIPNTEVRVGLMNALVPNYLGVKTADMPIGEMAGLLRTNIPEAFEYLKQYFKTVPYCNNIDYEGSCQREQSQACLNYAECSRGSATPSHWQQMLYVMFSLLGAYGNVEVHTSDGRMNLTLMLYGKIFIMEIKLDGTAEEAMRQIKEKDYASRFALTGLPIVKICVNFSTRERTITEYIIEE